MRSSPAAAAGGRREVADQAHKGRHVDARNTGNPEDLGEIESWRRELVRFATRQLGPDTAAAAEDIVQDAYEHLMRRAIADAPPDHARAWLYAVVRSRCRDERTRRTTLPLEVLNDVESHSARTDEVVIAAAASHWMLEQVDALPDAERSAVMTTLAGGRATDSAGSANASYQALHRARARLRRAYDGAWAGGVVPLVLLWRGGRRAAGVGQGIVGCARGSSVAARLAVAGGVAVTAVTAPAVLPLIRHDASGISARTSGSASPWHTAAGISRSDRIEAALRQAGQADHPLRVAPIAADVRRRDGAASEIEQQAPSGDAGGGGDSSIVSVNSPSPSGGDTSVSSSSGTSGDGQGSPEGSSPQASTPPTTDAGVGATATTTDGSGGN